MNSCGLCGAEIKEDSTLCEACQCVQEETDATRVCRKTNKPGIKKVDSPLRLMTDVGIHFSLMKSF